MARLSEGEKTIMTMCQNHCISTCLLKLHLKDGRIVRIETDDGTEPQHRACLKGRAYRQLLYHPDRLQFPLRRTGQRGEGKFERVSWDEALETVASQIKRVRDTYGGGANVLISSAGDLGWLHNGGLIERVFVRSGGYTGVLGTVSCEGSLFASMASFGASQHKTSNSRDSLLKSRLILLWGWNPAASRSHGDILWYLGKVKELGIRVIAVDPRYTETAALLADKWIPIRPGTDTAMMVGMAYVMIREQLEDRDFLNKHTLGFGAFEDYVLGREDGIPKTPEWASQITGVSVDDIVSLAREYAGTKPAALMNGYAPARTAFGEQADRAGVALAAMTGNIGVAGGSSGIGAMVGVQRVSGPGFICARMKGGDNPLDLTAPMRKGSVFYQKLGGSVKGFSSASKWYGGGPSASYLNRVRLADALLKGRSGGYPYDYKLLYMVNINYLNQYANTNKIAQALRSLEFVVTQEQFMTPTAKFADIVLPTNTYMERNDVNAGNLSPVYGYMNQAVDTLGDTKSHYDIACGLASKMGFTDFAEKSEEEWLRETVQDCGEIADYDAFKKEGIWRVDATPLIAWEEQIRDPVRNPFPTPSGKIEIYSQDLADMNDPLIPPIPKYIQTWESLSDPLSKRYPLQLITTHTKLRVHSQFNNVPWMRELEPQAVLINSIDALARGINDGDSVMVFNDRGRTVVTAGVTERIMPGVVDIPEGAWYDPDEDGIDTGGCPNVLTRDEPSPGGAFAGNTVLVEVRKV